MQWENLFYALTQLVHNFGALAVVAGAAAGFMTAADNLTRKKTFAGLVFLGWAAQALSGLGFGAISFIYYGETPDLHSTAQVAFVIKLVCAVSGLATSLLLMLRGRHMTHAVRQRLWLVLTLFGATALTAAAFLRWFS